ncbi:MAG: ABC transporter permease subunit [Gemmatimonadales bacterium]|jgi:ABC-type transport system involved in multi-copper enzyme maturation permease subunit
MIWTIARREISEALVTGRTLLLFVIAVTLLGTGLYVLDRDYDARRANYDVIRPDPTQPIAVAPPSPLSVFARGLDDAMGRSFEISVIGIDIGGSQASANPLFGLFPTPDWLYLFRVVFALIAFLFGFDLICAAKERGTLKLMVASGASRGQIALGKWLGNWLALIVPIALAAGVWLVLARPVFGVVLRAGDGARLAVFLALAAVYLSVCYTIAVAISSLLHRAATALVAALLTWVALVFVIPSFGVLAARQVVHVRPLALVQAERSRIFGSEMMKAFDERRAGRTGPVFQEHWQEMHRQGDLLSDRVAGEFGSLARTSALFVRISPAGAFDGLATSILGTSVADEWRLKRDVRRYKNAILPEVFEQRSADAAIEYPAFTATRAPLADVLAAGRANIASIVFLGALAGMVLFIAINRYDIR